MGSLRPLKQELAASWRAAARHQGFLKKCATSRKTLETPRRVSPSSTRGERRRSRLARGVDRWELDVRWRHFRRTRTLLFTLTTETADWDQVEGAWSRVIHEVERVFGRQTYFGWLELQQRGALHVHVVWINPPFLEEWTFVEYLQELWGLGHVDQRDYGRVETPRAALDYALAYAKKHGDKAASQDYDRLPLGWHTFFSSLKVHPGEVLDKHLDRWDAVYREGVVELIARLEHSPVAECEPRVEQLDWWLLRRRERAGRRAARSWTNAEAAAEDRRSFIGARVRGQTLGRSRPRGQPELLSEYAEWAVRVESLPW